MMAKSTVFDILKRLTRNDFEKAFNKVVNEWVDYDVSSVKQVIVGNEKLTLLYRQTKVGDRYEVLRGRSVIAWNDNHKDFRQIGGCVYGQLYGST